MRNQPGDYQPGDIVACYGHDLTSRIISWGTASLVAPRRLSLGPSHVAMLCHYEGAPLWVESTTLCSTPCVIRGQLVAGAQAHFPDDRIDDYAASGGRAELYRLSPLMQLSLKECKLLNGLLIEQLVKKRVRYDLAGAIFSGTRAFQLTRLFPGADLNELFCSELVAAVSMRLGRMNHGNPTRFNPARLLRELVRHGTYRHVGQLKSRHAA